MKKKVISKGYTLEIVSWENDGDNYNTINHTVKSLEEANRLHKICTELFCSHHNGEKGIGNSMEGEGLDNIIDFVKNNKELFTDLEVDVEKININNTDEYDADIEELYDYFHKISLPFNGRIRIL